MSILNVSPEQFQQASCINSAVRQHERSPGSYDKQVLCQILLPALCCFLQVSVKMLIRTYKMESNGTHVSP